MNWNYIWTWNRPQGMSWDATIGWDVGIISLQAAMSVFSVKEGEQTKYLDYGGH